jgi:pimeloyl-ACP methyl ester carboxylesterase
MSRTRGYLGEALVVEHAPPGRARGAVVILTPLGYEDTSAYRPLRVLADELAGAGLLVVRVDWPGLGDSAGSALDPDLHARQVAAVRAVAASLQARGFAELACLGVRAGGLLALEAGGFAHLALWGAPASGRALLREERAFHRMAAKAFGDAPARAPLPEGAVEAGGFLYGPAQVKALEALSPTGRGVGVRRALVIAREGTEPPKDLLTALAGAEVTTAAGGLGDLLDDPYKSKLNEEVRALILRWLSPLGAAVDAGPPRLAATLEGDGWVERPWLGEGGVGQLTGIRCEPARGAPPNATWTLFFNAGGVRRSGPNRLWTQAARALAAVGRPSLRLDVRDVGDADGVSTPHRDLEAMYSDASVEDAVAGWDAARAFGAGDIDVVGLCSGAFLGIQVAARRPVRRAVLFNCLAYVWDDDARSNGVTSQIGRSLLDGRRWRRLLTGRIDARAVATGIGRRALLRAGELRARLRGDPPRSAVDALLSDVGRHTRLVLVSSAGDPSVAYLARHVPEERRPPLTMLQGVDHTVRPVAAHAQVVELILG